MMIKINPIKIEGPWELGYSLDLHSISSERIGTNSYGRPIWSTERTDIGEVVYQIKYKKNLESLNLLVETAGYFLRKNYDLNEKPSGILGVPPSETSRGVQPTFILARKISKYIEIEHLKSYLVKVKTTPQIKNAETELREDHLVDCFKILNKEILSRMKNIIVIDDIYETGATLRTITQCFKSLNNNIKVQILTMTKTRG